MTRIALCLFVVATLVWSYSVNKGRGQKNRQSLAEAIAVHMKDEYFGKQR